MLRAIAGSGAKSREARDRIREAITDPVNGAWLLADVSQSDPDWVLQHSRRVTCGQAERVQIALANLADAKHRERFVAALREESPEFRRDATARLGRVIRDPKELERLSKLLSD
jgi:hypothetical protein